MSIKADRWIIKKSTLPSHRVTTEGVYSGWAWDSLGECQPGDHNTCGEGVVKGFIQVNEEDIKAFRAEFPWHPMIEPFEAQQVRGQPETFEEFKLRIVRESFSIPPTRDPEGRWQRMYDHYLANHPGKKVSYGTSSYGYDVRCADEFKVFTNINNSIVDPKNFDPKCFVDVVGDKCIIPPNSFALARTVEWFKIPRNVLTICLGKSTYARCGIIVNVTPLEPEWEGHVTLEFSNTTNLPAVIYANEGVAQMLFLESDEECLTSYKDRGGKYQGQSGVVVPRMK